MNFKRLLNDFIKQKECFIKYCNKHEDNIYFYIAAYSCTSMIPVTVLYYYYGEHFGFDPELKRRIIELCIFYEYDYTEVFNE